MSPDLSAFQRKFDKTLWNEKGIHDQANLTKEFLTLRGTIDVKDSAKLEADFQRKLGLSRDEWFRLLISSEAERLQLLGEACKRARVYIIPTPSGIFPAGGWLGEFVYDYGRVIESPDSFLFWSGVCVLSACIRTKLFVKFGTRRLFPNFYVILVARSGAARKGAPIKAAEEFARTLPGINLLDRTTTERLPHDLSFTMQNVGGAMQKVPCDAQGFLCAEELVAFLDDQSYNSGVIKFLTEWWDCPTSKGIRSFKHGIVQLKNICVILLGGTTPDWLQSALSHLVMGGGMLSRTVFVNEERTLKRISWPGEPDDNCKQRLVQQLNAIDAMQGEFVVTDDALAWTDVWYQGFRNYLEANESEAAAIERKQIHMIKLAMILAVSEGLPHEITPALLERAKNIMDEQEKGLPELARSLIATPLGREHLRVLDHIRKAGGTIRHSDLLRKNSPYGINKDGLKMIADTLEESDQIEIFFDKVTNAKMYKMKVRP